MNKYKRINIIVFILILAVMTITVGFAALSKTLSLSDLAAGFRLNVDLRITDFYTTSSSNGGSSTYVEYNHNLVVTDIILPNQNSSVTYKVEVTNIGSRIAQIDAFINLPDNITYELSGYTLGEDICNNDICKNGVVKEFFITFKYVSNGYDSSNNPSGTYHLVAQALWNYKVKVTYKANVYYTESTTLTGNNTNLSVNYNPVSSELLLNGNAMGTAVGTMYIDSMSFNEGDIYRLNVTRMSGSASVGQLVPLYNLRILDSNHQTISGQTNFSDIEANNVDLIVSSAGAASGSTLAFIYQVRHNTTFTNYLNKITIEKIDEMRIPYSANYILPDYTPVRNGYTFDGWYTAETGGVEITENDIIDSSDDIVLYAHWIDNDVMTPPIISYQDNSYSTGLLFYYSARNNTGSGHNSSSTTWIDLNNNHNGTLNGPTWSNEYLSFDGTNDYVLIDYLTANYYTLDATINISQIVSGETVIVGNPNNGGAVLMLNNGKPKFQEYIDSEWISVEAPNAIELNQPHYIAGTHYNNYLRLYVDGNLVAKQSISGTITNPTNSTNMVVGCNPEGTTCIGNYFKGKIYSVRAYSGSLTAAQITQNYATDSLFVNRYTNISPVVRITGGSSGIGIRSYEYSISPNLWNAYDDSNKPTITSSKEFSSRVVNNNYSKGPAATENIYIDKQAPTGISLDVTTSGFTINVTVSAEDALSGIGKYGYMLTTSSTCNSNLDDFVYSTNNTYSLDASLNSTQYVCVKVIDNANNSAYSSQKLPAAYYAYTGSSQSFTADTAGYYYVELYGAEGGNANATYKGGEGGKTTGYIYLNENDTLYVFVGGKGYVNEDGSSNCFTGGYNGGGTGCSSNYTGRYTGTGGGGTDIRLSSNQNDYYSRLMVAGGGGGSWYYNSSYRGYGGDGGNLVAEDGIGNDNGTTTIGTGGNQIGDDSRLFGEGYHNYMVTTPAPGPVGGYWGGQRANRTSGGGSSFISGFAGSNAITSSSSSVVTNTTLHYSGKYVLNGYMESGVNVGNGKAKIEYCDDCLSGSNLSGPLLKSNTPLQSVRYIKDCTNGSTSYAYNQWIEIQAINTSGTNVAKNKTVTGTSPQISTDRAYSFITDGMIDNKTTEIRHGRSTDNGYQCVTVDLGSTYSLNEIAVWHYYTDGRVYNENTTYVSTNNSTWTPVINNSQAESDTGKRVTAWDPTLTPYTVHFASNVSGCTLNPTTYADRVTTYGSVISAPNPTCNNYYFNGWNASGNINTTTAKYGTTANPSTSWVNGNKGTYFRNLSTVENGTVTLTANFVALSEFPTCSLKMTTSNVTFNTKTDNNAVTGFDLTKSSTPSYNGTSSVANSVGTFYGYVKDADNYTGSCTLQVVNTTSNTTYSCYKNYDGCTCGACVVYNNSCWERYANQSNGSCSSGYTPYGSRYCQKYKSPLNACAGSGWTNTNNRCEKYNQSNCSGSTVLSSNTTYSCPSTYTKLNNTYCYK